MWCYLLFVLVVRDLLSVKKQPTRAKIFSYPSYPFYPFTLDRSTPSTFRYNQSQLERELCLSLSRNSKCVRDCPKNDCL